MNTYDEEVKLLSSDNCSHKLLQVNEACCHCCLAAAVAAAAAAPAALPW